MVCYLDGFGIGSDADQRLFLSRVAGWVRPGGRALIDVFTPWYWAAHHGEEYSSGRAAGRFTSDAERCRMVGEMWLAGDRSETATQWERCYSPADLQLLLEGTGLTLSSFEAYDTEAYGHRDDRAEAMRYLAKLRRSD